MPGPVRVAAVLALVWLVLAPASPAHATRPWPNDRRPQLGDGTPAGELRVNAKRLVGLRNSFTPDSFIRHLCFSADLSGRDRFPADGWARALHRHLARKHAVRTKGVPEPGDLVLFRLQATRSNTPDRVLVGVVDSVQGRSVRFIAPIEDTVMRGLATLKGATGKDTALLPCGRKGTAAGKSGPPPCRAGDLYLGFVSANALARALR